MSPSHRIDPALLARLVSTGRLQPYLAASRGDLAAAVQLYEWNARISAALWETIGHVEVLLRNAMHAELTAWSTRRYRQPSWYLDPGGLLHYRPVEDIKTARRRATRAGGTETPGRVVAELPFGFWRYLTIPAYDRSLWRTCLFKAFPGQSRVDVQNALAALHVARNRCAHHEPMHNRPIQQLHDTALEIAGWIDQDGRRWVSARSRVPRNLATRP